MAVKRSEQIDTDNGGYYHLISRCVRRAFLCGDDPESGKNFNYRREWIEQRILELANYFSVEVYSYAVMQNHYHMVVYCDPKLPLSWSDLEVADRWLKVFPGKLNNPKFKQQRELRLRAIVADPELLKIYRERLGSLSWLMRCINEPIAKRCNREDFVKGHFWESRFKSQALLDEAAALTCMAYVDLNPIRAGDAKDLNTSSYTSIKKRLDNLSVQKLNTKVNAIAGSVKNRAMVLKLKSYIELVEWTAQAIVYPDKAALPPHLCNTLSHMNIQQAQWLSQVKSYGSRYYRFVGNIEKLKAKSQALGLQWLKGITQAQRLFSPTI
jgi:putative transposase